jgi:signal transduction histidine kinase
MNLVGRLLPRTITAQITCIVIVAVLLGVGLASTVVFALFNNLQSGARQDIMATARAARIAAIVHRAEAFPSRELLAKALDSFRSPTLDVEIVVPDHMAPVHTGAAVDSEYVKMVKAYLAENWGIASLPSPMGGGDDSIVVALASGTTLAFEPYPRTIFHNFFLVQTICAVAIVICIVLFLSLYALRSITAPLSSFASAARSFGRSAADEGALSEGGPREISQVAEALNDMRRRVRSLVDERTQMLLAISHDLRTPLTRLRLRCERLSDAKLRDNMLHDIATINEMLGETLAYLREGGPLEPAHLIELPSLLQTICAQFTDIGNNVSYSGPDRLAFGCRVNAVTRAIANLVDNGTKHGAAVIVALERLHDGKVQIDVSDDGPGIAAEIREKVFQPFFKGDSARNVAGRGGFGLGLSIAREIIRRHGGGIQLVDRTPSGVTVRVTLTEQPVGKIWNIPAGEEVQHGA